MNNSFNYALMLLLCKEVRERVINFKVVDCFPNHLHRFFLVLRKQEHQEILFFCFTPPFIRFHLITSSIPPVHKHSSHALLSLLQGAILKDVCLLQQDRILQLTFSTRHGERRLIAEFFNKHPNYYLVQPNNTILFTLHSHARNDYQLPSPRPFSSESAYWLTHQEVEQAYLELEKKWEFTTEKQLLHKQLSKQIEKLQRKERELLENLKQCSQWSNVQHEGDLIKAYFASIQKGTSSITVHDWLIDQPYHLKLNPAKTLQEQMSARFKRAKKLQAGQKPLLHYLECIQQELHHLDKQQQQLNQLTTTTELTSFKQSISFYFSPPQSHTPPIKSTSSIYKIYKSTTGMQIWVGKNAKANNKIFIIFCDFLINFCY